MAEQITKIISDNEKISWGSRSFYVVRNDVLQEVFKYKDVEIGEKYCTITQTPSTPPDFGLILSEKNSDGFDKEINSVLDFMLINPKGLKDFILGTKEFKNWYEKS
jgi:hypothetical protein